MRIRKFSRLCTLISAGTLAAVAAGTPVCFAAENDSAQTATLSANAETPAPKIDMTRWRFNEQDQVFYQLGIRYAKNHPDEKYATLGIFVPAKYFSAKKNPDGQTYSVRICADAQVAGFTPDTAPFVMPTETPGYSAHPSPQNYAPEAKTYTDTGFIYLLTGARGRTHGAPAGVVDFKAAIRFVRSCAGTLPGDASSVFSFGMSGGGAQSALLGATGDSPIFKPYLDAIGAVSDQSDAVAGSMCWCPITNLVSADAAYEWELGASRKNLSPEEKNLSDALAGAFADYVNALGLSDEAGTPLRLEKSDAGDFHAGTYHARLLAEIETSLNNFLSDTTFPCELGGRSRAGGGRPPFPPHHAPRGENAAHAATNTPPPLPIEARDGIRRNSPPPHAGNFGGNAPAAEPRRFETAQDYIDFLNAAAGTPWLVYDARTNTAKAASVADFSRAVKNASKTIGAFDSPDRRQGENILFGHGDGNGAHFDSIMAKILAGTPLGDEYAADIAKKDALGNGAEIRVNAYDPLYFLAPANAGFRTAKVARHWRIRTGIFQGDAAVSTELLLAIALKSYGGLDVDFADVWNLRHVKAERAGTPDENFIAWVRACAQGDGERK